MRKQTQLSDYIEFLQGLDHHGKVYFLEGGQAVNFWAEYYYARSASHNKLEQLKPFTSKDCDIWVNQETLQYIESQAPHGCFKKGSSPADGQIAIYTLDGPPPKEVDLMSAVYGIYIDKENTLIERSLNYKGIRVLDPLYLFQSKCCCLTGLPQPDRQDRKHLFILLAILPEYFHELHAKALKEDITERQLITELKLLLKICSLRRVKEAIQLVERQAEELFPIELLKTSDLLKVQQFTHDTLLRKLAK